MRDDEYVVGLYLGTTKVCAVVGRVEKSESASGGESLKILGLGQAASNGIKKGIVVTIEETVESIRKAVQDAELMAGVPIERAVVGVAGAHIKGFNSSGVVGIKGKEIQKEDLNRVIDAARAVAIPSDRTALHVLPQEFKIDDQDGIRNPLGMMGTRLEAKVHIVTAAQRAIQTIDATNLCEVMSCVDDTCRAFSLWSWDWGGAPRPGSSALHPTRCGRTKPSTTKARW